ncbi:MAG: phosphomethylpyrimidine synthase ThiC [Planctomycetes bacterium]|nr:phosphomethylpyrimidine synthase ThiC [Planctomycetota bacterium]
MTQLQQAKAGKITPEMRRVARAEGVSPQYIRDKIAEGHLIIPCNRRRKAAKVFGIGEGLRTKVNANLGTSKDYADVKVELEKLRAAEEAGADTVMDLSTGGDISAIRARIMAESSLPIGTVPIYEAAVQAATRKHSIRDMTAASILGAVRHHCEDGVDFVTVHCGVTRRVVEEMRRSKRVCGIVSRGGTFLAEWMTIHKRENPLYEHFDELLAMAAEHDVTLSLGDGMRPGALADAFDRPQVHELEVLAELFERAYAAGVQVMVEGPGHVPMNQIQAQVQLQKAMCHGAPFYVLGPLVTDIAPGYDHITAAIGGAIAAAAGADFLCYVTPSEHLGLPKPDDVREGVIAARIAGHAADLAKGIKGAWEWDKSFSTLRRQRDWKGQLSRCIDPVRARQFRDKSRPHDDDVCSMCGEYCVFKLANGKRKKG